MIQSNNTNYIKKNFVDKNTAQTKCDSYMSSDDERFSSDDLETGKLESDFNENQNNDCDIAISDSVIEASPSNDTNSSNDKINRTKKSTQKFRTKQSSNMKSPVLSFNNINFHVGNKQKQQKILDNVSGKIKWGHVLAVMGPSGAGKSTLINALILDALYGKVTGSATLNGVPMTADIFKQHCYIVPQHDKHWPFLTCRETLTYATELYDVAHKSAVHKVVDDILKKMGLDVCADTRTASLSGGQRRRLSIGVALLKQPTVLFLDEPTSSLDSAAAENIMEEIVTVAREERLIVFCTIHQPSTKVYNKFDQVMILSKGRQAYSGYASAAPSYFASIGHPMPQNMNPAEHMLDLVNADFSDDSAVEEILNQWEQTLPNQSKCVTCLDGDNGDDDDDNNNDVQDSVDNLKQNMSWISEVLVMLRRHQMLITRDPILYLGRCIAFLLMNSFFAIVYFRARVYQQDEAIYKVWINLWFICVPTNMATVAVYVLNGEFKTLLQETKNGMVRPMSYIIAKSILVIPIMFIFAIFALGIPCFVIMNFPTQAVASMVLLFAVALYQYECVAECFAVITDNPVIGMLHLVNYWFASFLFAGVCIPQDSLYWPFNLILYVMPFGYYVRSAMYQLLKDTTFDSPCDRSMNIDSPVCVDSTNGSDVLDGINVVVDVVENEDTFVQDIVVLLGMALVFKCIQISVVLRKTHEASDF